MPPKKRLEATVFIIDCSKDVDDRLRTFYEIFSMKYFSQTKGLAKDIHSIFLYNCSGLKPKILLNDWSNYGFEMLKQIKQTLKSAKTNDIYKSLNFLNMLNAALEQLDKDDIKDEYIKRIVFITDLSSPNSFDQRTNQKIDFLKHELYTRKIWLYVIGLNTKLINISKQNEINKFNKIEPLDELTEDQKINYDVLSRFDRNVVYVDKQHGVDVFFAHKIEPKPPYPWYVKLNIGTDLEIPVMAYRTTRHHEIVKFMPCPSDQETPVSGVKLWYDVNTHERVQITDVVKGYKFQQKFVVITDEQYKDAKKIITKKCLTVVGFASADEVPYNLLIMADTMACLKADPRQKQSAADRRFQLLVTSLKVKKVVALAYRVYNDGNGRKLYCIFPCPEHTNDNHLLMGQFPYEHEFQEGFFKGKIESSNYSDTWELMKNFLEKMSPVDEETKQDLYPLPPSVQVSHSRSRMTEFLLYKSIEEDVPNAPLLTMNAIIEKRAEKAADALHDKIHEND